MNGKSSRPSPNQGGTTECEEPSSLNRGMEAFVFFRLVKMAFCFVLAALNSSTYETMYASPSRLLRSCRKSILTSLGRWTINEVKT